MDFLLPTVVLASLITCLAFSLAAQSLRDFSRTRLWELCQRRGVPDRFTRILKHHESAFLACDALGLLSIVLFTLSSASWLGLRLHHDARLTGTAILGGIGLACAAVAVRLVLPWSLSRIMGESLLCRCWPLLQGLHWLLVPLTYAAHRFDRLGHRAAGRPEPGTGDAAALSLEIQNVVDEGEREGLIESKAGTMIRRVIELHDEDIGSVMTPRTDMITLPSDASIEDARRRFIEAGHSRIPVIGESIDDVVGVLYAKDLLTLLADDTARDRDIQPLVRSPFYVPVTTSVDTVLETMKRERNHLAIVVDEYGGVAGLVTLEDVLEEIVGDIVDEYDPAEETGIVRHSETLIESAGWVHLDDLNDEFDLEFPEDEDFDTLGGFIVNELARVPEAGEELAWRNLRLTVIDADPRKVNRIRVEILEADALY